MRLTPCLPADWPEFRIHYRYRQATYHIVVTQMRGEGGLMGVTRVVLDGVEQGEKMIVLVDTQVEHLVEVMVGL